ncbi:hypothetical protein TCE0_011f00495 [Talaromyces pinophilus]|uniref:Cytochrome P450 n=1 Tax=Talaromyces pinophilus TaxID=128442 RepID=A0A0B8N2J1_TALPI|nr:hypothetical protein TCE0_011f00495 [Talaromyces pinophilus]
MLSILETKSALLLITSLSILTIGYFRVSRYLEIRNFKKLHNCQPPIRAPQSERIIGLSAFLKVLAFRRDHVSLEQTLKKGLEIGRTNTAVILGQNIVFTCDPENLKTVLATNFLDYGLGPRVHFMGPLLGEGIFTSDDVAWHHSRDLIRPCFTRTQIADLEALENHVQALISCLPPNGTTVDLQPLFYNFTIDSATEFLVGQSVGCQGSGPGSAGWEFSQALDYAEAAIEKRNALGKHAWLLRDPKFHESCKIVHRFTENFINETLKGNSKPGRYNLLDELANSCRDPIRLRNELLNVLVAARDTTASLLGSIFYFLARHPDTWDKLRVEVGELNGRLPDYQTLKDMKYLKSVLNETLRLIPPVPLNERFARKDTVLPHGGGPDGQSPIFVAKESRVVSSVYAMHRLPEIWGNDAHLYRPERWLDEKLRPGWGFLAFNGGPRTCLGQQKALVETSYTVVRLLQVFDRIEPRDNQPWLEKLAISVTNVNGTKVAFWKAP